MKKNNLSQEDQSAIQKEARISKQIIKVILGRT